MTTDKVLALAREAGFIMSPESDNAYSADIYDGLCTPELIKFAALIQQQMIEDGWRQCAEGQGTTQYCGIAEELRKDAERYRWLRDKSEFKNERYTPRQVDADIDAAIEGMKLP